MKLYRLVDEYDEIVSPMYWSENFTTSREAIEFEARDLEQKYGPLRIQVALVGEWSN